MFNSINLAIAGIAFHITCRKAVISKDFNPAYSSFLRADESEGPCDVRVTLEFDNIPETSGLVKIFDSGQSWSLYEDDGYYLLELRPASLRHGPLWVTRFLPDVSEATVYCGNMLIKKQDGILSVTNPMGYPMDQILMMYVLARRGGMIIHAAGIEINNRAYIFPGRSGAGKSTISRQFALKKSFGLLSDDRMVLRRIKGSFIAFGTPWPGDAGIAANKNAELEGIYFIRQCSDNRIEGIAPRKAAENLFPVISVPWYDRDLTERALQFCDDLVSSVPSYELYFKPDKGVADLFEDFIRT